MISVSQVILLPLEGIYLWVTLGAPLWNHCNYFIALLKPCTILLKRGIIAYQLEPLSSTFPSPLMCVMCLSSRDVIMAHSMNWSWVARSSRRSNPVEFISVVVLDEDLESKDVKIKMMQWINILEKNNGIVKIVLAFVSPFPLTLRLNLGTRFLFSGGELSHP